MQKCKSERGGAARGHVGTVTWGQGGDTAKTRGPEVTRARRYESIEYGAHDEGTRTEGTWAGD